VKASNAAKVYSSIWRGQLEHTDGQRQRGVLEHAQEVAGQRRDDGAIGDRNQHVAIDLQGRETHGEAGIALAAWDRLYP
jgi:hypothetical protein